MTTKKLIIDTIADTVSGMMIHERIDDEDLPRGEIEAAIERGDISVDEIVRVFGDELRGRLG